MKYKLIISYIILSVLNFILFSFVLWNTNLNIWSVGTRLTFAFSCIFACIAATVIISIVDDISLLDDEHDI
jgi:hypothetical protein